MKKYFLALTIPLIAFSCSFIEKESNEVVKSLPSFYITPKNNNKYDIYGVGAGNTMEESTKFALADAASRLSVTISGESSLLTQENRYDYSSELRSKVKQNIEEINFSDFKISESKKYQEKFYTEVKIDRQKFIQLQQEKIKFNDRQIYNLKNDLSSQNYVKKRNSLIQMLNIAQKSALLTRIVYKTESGNLQKKLKEVADIKNMLSKFNNKFEFYLIDLASEGVYDVVKENISKENIDISKRRSSKVSQVAIKIRSSKSVGEVYGSYVTKLKIWFDNIDHSGKIIASNSIEVSGSSVVSARESYKSALKSLDKTISSSGALEVLGIN